MSHTPEQGLTLWCPMVRHDSTRGGSFNRGPWNSNPTNADAPVDGVTAPVPEQRYGCHCIADKCAMWRWPKSAVLQYVNGALTMRRPGLDQEPAWGYCGLAGKPGGLS